jgi:hypothetical protein
MATKFLNTAFGLKEGGLAAWLVAGGIGYYWFYKPELAKREGEMAKAAHANALMKQPQYVEFVKQHEAGGAGKEKEKRKGWLGGLFGGGKKPKEPKT